MFEAVCQSLESFMTTKEHVARHDKHDREIAAIRKLLLTGMKMLDRYREETQRFREETHRFREENQKYFTESRKEMKDLREAQKRTEASLKAFIDSMRGAGNGHAKGKVDLR